jgi:hypothetical protein
MLHLVDGTGTLAKEGGGTTTVELPAGWYLTEKGKTVLDGKIAEMQGDNAVMAQAVIGSANGKLGWVIVGAVAGALITGTVVAAVLLTRPAPQ